MSENQVPTDEELMKSGDARKYLGVGLNQMAEWMRTGELTVYQKDINKRIKWVRRDEVEALKKRLNIPKKLVPAA